MLRRVLVAGLFAVASLVPVGANAQFYPAPPYYAPPPPPVYAPPAGCVYYEHAEFQGASFAVNGSSSLDYVGQYWNDRISSIACSPYCTVTVWEHANYGGRSWRTGGRVPYVGQGWNDRVSSLVQRC